MTRNRRIFNIVVGVILTLIPSLIALANVAGLMGCFAVSWGPLTSLADMHEGVARFSVTPNRSGSSGSSGGFKWSVPHPPDPMEEFLSRGLQVGKFRITRFTSGFVLWFPTWFFYILSLGIGWLLFCRVRRAPRPFPVIAEKEKGLQV